MAYSCKIIADSVGPNSVRLTTFQITLPRIIWAEFLTHRCFSRNSASSRAIPVKKMLSWVREDPFVPVYFGKNQKGMQAEQELTGFALWGAKQAWFLASRVAIAVASLLLWCGVHKQITNRVLEPFLWHTVIVSGTDFQNFFKQRCSPLAQPEIRKIADMIKVAYTEGEPVALNPEEWHLPYITEQDWQEVSGYIKEEQIEILRSVCVARCARVSYLSQEGLRSLQEDLKLYQKLLKGNHASPLEHCAEATLLRRYFGNFYGWIQYRKTIPGECVIERFTN